jgi:hypothetical protein
MAIQELIGRVLELRQQAMNARLQAERDRRQRRQENDRYVTGGVNWNGYGLETLIKFVAERASPGQLDSLADEWRRHGSSVAQASNDLQRSLDRLMPFWTGASADNASRVVTTNARWVSELGGTAQQMAGPIQDAGGALRSAQDTMPGKPSDPWYLGAGGGALAGFAVAGPIGFGSSKRKLKRKAVQTMERYEAALLGVDSTTPQFGLPSDGVNPGADPIRNPGTGVGTPTPGQTPPGATPPSLTPGGRPGDISTVPSFGNGDPGSRWRAITGGPTPGFGGLGPGGAGPGFGGLPGMVPPGGFGRGGGPGGSRTGGSRIGGGIPGGGLGTGRGGTDTTRRSGAPGRSGLPVGGGLGGRGAGGQDGQHRNRTGTGTGRGSGPLGGGLGGRGTGQDSERNRARGTTGTAGAGAGRYGAGGLGAGTGRGLGMGAGSGRGGSRGRSDSDADSRDAAGGFGPGAGPGAGAGLGPGGRGGIGDDEERRGRGRFGRGGALDAHGSGYGAGGAGARREEDEEHHRKFPVEEDPFSSSDLKAAPPVIGL